MYPAWKLRGEGRHDWLDHLILVEEVAVLSLHNCIPNVLQDCRIRSMHLPCFSPLDSDYCSGDLVSVQGQKHTLSSLPSRHLHWKRACSVVTEPRRRVLLTAQHRAQSGSMIWCKHEYMPSGKGKQDSNVIACGCVPIHLGFSMSSQKRAKTSDEPIATLNLGPETDETILVGLALARQWEG